MAAEEIAVNISMRRWVLTSPQDMWSALLAFQAQGYRGGVFCGPGVSGDTTWQMEMHLQDMQPIPANIGQVIVQVNGMVQVLSVENYETIYGALNG